MRLQSCHLSFSGRTMYLGMTTLVVQWITRPAYDSSFCPTADIGPTLVVVEQLYLGGPCAAYVSRKLICEAATILLQRNRRCNIYKVYGCSNYSLYIIRLLFLIFYGCCCCSLTNQNALVFDFSVQLADMSVSQAITKSVTY